jgi:predicted RND superfamily exporter protein
MGVLGVPVTITTVTLPSILLALGCAYCMHLLTAVATAGEGRVEEALCDIALPVMLSGLTTAVGFVAMTFVRIDAIRDIGTYGALGVLAVVLCSLTVAPAVMRMRPPPDRLPRLYELLHDRLPPRLVELASSRSRSLVAGWLLVGAVTLVGLAGLRVETDVIVWFRDSDPIRVSYERIKSSLVGISPVNIVIEAKNGKSVTAPEAIAAIDGLATHMEGLAEVGRSLSIRSMVDSRGIQRSHYREMRC